MKRIRLVVTGDLERAALGRSLARVLEAAGAKMDLADALKLKGCMTTTPLPELTDPVTPSAVQSMARALVTETTSSPSGRLPDLVLGIDDLELANAGRAERVVAWVRRGVQEELDRRYPTPASRAEADRVREALRRRCSFHLLVPMAEAYFFGERSALSRAGVTDGTAVHRATADVEDFETDDPDFLPRAALCNAEKAAVGAPWWREERHPKKYLEFLVERSGGFYREVSRGPGGARALETLDWAAVVAPGATLFARALFDDLSAALDITNPLGTVRQSACTYPSSATRPGVLTLRNL